MKDFIMVALAETQDEVYEFTYIYKIASIGYKFRKMGKIAYMRMKKGDFTNTPKPKSKQKQEDIKGYDINAK